VQCKTAFASSYRLNGRLIQIRKAERPTIREPWAKHCVRLVRISLRGYKSPCIICPKAVKKLESVIITIDSQNIRGIAIYSNPTKSTLGPALTQSILSGRALASLKTYVGKFRLPLPYALIDIFSAVAIPAALGKPFHYT
jgi:hypothetical protein